MDQDAASRRGTENGVGDRRREPFYRLGSNQSGSSIFEDVEMAHEELFSGPIAESLPTSVSAFSHRRGRADSTASFTYYHDGEDDDIDDEANDIGSRYNDAADVEEGGFLLDGDEDSVDLNEDAASQDYVLQRRSSIMSRSSVRQQLLRRDSAATAASGRGFKRTTQKLYLANEDLTIAIAGFRTSPWGLLLYSVFCVCTLGMGYLLLRWLPRWQVRLVGRPSYLADCAWVVVENQWGEMVILDVESRRYGRALSTIFVTGGKGEMEDMDDESDPLLQDIRIINYRYVRLFFHPMKDVFVLFAGWKDVAWTDVKSVRAGLDSEEKVFREVVFGGNIIDIEQKSIPKLLVDEVLHPFYVFQVASLILWSLEEYYYYAVAIFLMSLGSIATTLVETRQTMKRLREISKFECDVRVLRSGFWRHISSCDLVPGDVYEVSDPSLAQFPADSLLLSGDCIVNESMLTGESVPVSKLPTSDEALAKLDLAASTVTPEVARHFLFCGTKIVRARRPQDSQNGDAVGLGLVVRTGFNTTKGALVRSMLFPKPSGFKFYRDSFRYISVMAIIAILGFVASLVNFVRLQIDWDIIIIRALDLVTIVVPPALPATLTIGTNFALARLKKRQIFCISPQRVNVGGKLDIMCFDKTGTLTEDGLDILGVRVVAADRRRFDDTVFEAEKLADDGETGLGRQRSILFAMATCHSLRTVEGELVGDPLEVKMFEFTGWSFEEGQQGNSDHDDEEQAGLSPSVARPPPGGWASGDGLELGILKAFEFVSQLRRASVVVRQFGRPSGDVYVKGAPECMRDICRPESFPGDFDELLSFYTHKGYRVIACATKHIARLSWVKAQKMKREEVESGLDFVGFIIFENKLKPATAAVLKELGESNIGTVMVTGDNILTAISVGRECGLMDRLAHCYVARFVHGSSRDADARLQWESIDNAVYRLDADTLMPEPVPPEADASLPLDISNLRDYSIAVSGDVFRWVVDFASPLVLHRMLVRGSVFARMSPDEKHELVEKLQSIDYTCGFCGDGANDCGALKAADVGISLSEAEASVAAPFTSRIFDISCVPLVIREGRAALVTSFSCFKYMSLYSAIQFTSVSFLYATASNLGDFQFLFIDLVLILPIAVFMSWSGPFPTLCRKRPTADLVSRKVLVPLLGHMAIAVATQAACYLAVRRQPWYIPPKIKHKKSNIKNSENTVLFLISCFEYIFAGVVLNAGPPFRQPARQNWPFILTTGAALMMTLYMVLGPAHSIKKLMELTKTRWDFELFMVLLGCIYLVVAWLCANFTFPWLARLFGRAKVALSKQPKKRKAYKEILDGMRH